MEFDTEIHHFQSNHERIIDQIHQWADSGFDGLILNPGGFLPHTSVALGTLLSHLDCKLWKFIFPTYMLEDFRHKSLISGVASAIIAGMGERRVITPLFVF